MSGLWGASGCLRCIFIVGSSPQCLEGRALNSDAWVYYLLSFSPLLDLMGLARKQQVWGGPILHKFIYFTVSVTLTSITRNQNLHVKKISGNRWMQTEDQCKRNSADEMEMRPRKALTLIFSPLCLGALCHQLCINRAFPVAQMVKNPPAMQETWVWSLGQEDPLEEGMAAHSSILTWKIPCAEEPGGYSPWGHKDSDVTEQLNTAQHSMFV